jgi:hypothetical protein
MTKVMIEVPDNLHRLVKTVASSKGETMKHFMLRAMEFVAKQEAKINTNNSDNINETEADNLLKPYLSKLVDDISNGKEGLVDSRAFFDELAKS